MLYLHNTKSVVTRQQIIGALPSISRKATATDEQLIIYAAEHLGWDVSVVRPFAAPEGMVAVGSMTVVELDGVAYRHYETITQAEYDAQQAEAAAQASAAEEERKNTPLVWDQPFEIPALVLQSQSQGMGVGVVATDEGDLVTFTYHASPVPSATEIKQRIAEAIATHKATKQAAKAEIAELKAEVEKIKKVK